MYHLSLVKLVYLLYHLLPLESQSKSFILNRTIIKKNIVVDDINC